MATGGVLGNGVKVGYSANSPVSWTSVAQVLEVDFPELTPDKVDTTVHGSSKWKRSMAGMIEVSDMTLTLLADTDPSTTPGHDALWDYNQSQTTVWWRVEVPSNRTQSAYTAFEFQGMVAGIKLATPIDDKQTLTVVIRFDGSSLTKYDPAASAIS